MGLRSIDSRTDVFTREKRSEIMSHVRTKNTRPEQMVRSALHSIGARFRLHRKALPGCPDIVLPKYRTVIFVHGCFWHQHEGCRRAAVPQQNHEFWERKLKRNKERDQDAQHALQALGWNVVIVWGCEAKKVDDALLGKLRTVLWGQ